MHARPIQARQPAGTASRVVWLLRWLLVLVLVWDQVSAPLHHHGHDSGVDSAWLGASADIGQNAGPHLEGSDHDLPFSHAVLAVRPQLDLSSFFTGDDPGQSLVLFQTFARLWPSPGAHLIPDGASPAPPHSTHRSLPPAGRAPPLHT